MASLSAGGAVYRGTARHCWRVGGERMSTYMSIVIRRFVGTVGAWAMIFGLLHRHRPKRYRRAKALANTRRLDGDYPVQQALASDSASLRASGTAPDANMARLPLVLGTLRSGLYRQGPHREQTKLDPRACLMSFAAVERRSVCIELPGKRTQLSTTRWKERSICAPYIHRRGGVTSRPGCSPLDQCTSRWRIHRTP